MTKRTFLTTCALFLMAGTALRVQSAEPLTLSYGDGVSRIEITPDGYRLGSSAVLNPYKGAYVLTGTTGSDALEIYNESGVEQTFDITFDNLQIQAGIWEGAVAIKSNGPNDAIVLNLYSTDKSRVCSGNHTALASRGNKQALRIINLSVLDGTLTLETLNEAEGGFAWSSNYNTEFNLINTVTIDGETSFTNSKMGSVTLKPNYQYTSNNNGTHQRILGDNTVTEDCSYRYETVEGAEQHRGICIHCGYQAAPEPCTPSDEWVVKDELYHAKICSLCGQKVSPERHSDHNGDHKCDACGTIMLTEPATAGSTYQIGSVEELRWFAALVNGTLKASPQNTKASAVLTADIVINETVLTADGQLVEDTTVLMEWTSIGSQATPFEGTFDGQGHTINGLFVNRPGSDGQGLFGYIGEGGNVSRTEVTGSYIQGKNGVGGITGYNDGHLTACSYSGIVIGRAYEIGGVAGWNNGTLTHCHAAGKVHVTGFDPFAGGVVGDNYGAISFCYSTVSFSADHSGSAGGVASYNKDGHITYCYYLQGTTDAEVADNQGTIENVEPRTAGQFADGEVTWLLNGQSDKNPTWFQTIGTDDFPLLDNTHGTVYATGRCPGDVTSYTNQGPSKVGEHTDRNGDHLCDYCGIVITVKPEQVEGVYQIGDMAELYWFASLVNGNLATEAQNTAAAAVLTADIVVNKQVLTADGQLVEDTDGLLAWRPIGDIQAFNGTFDGQGHTISGLYINRPESGNQALFGHMEADAIVRNTGVTDGYIHANDHAAGIAARSKGRIENCHNHLTIVGNESYVAGICAYNQGKIINSRNDGAISNVNDESDKIGGIAGYNTDSISLCYNTGLIIGRGFETGGIVGKNESTVECCHNTGHVKGNEDVGGIVGVNNAPVKYCYNTGQVDGYRGIGGIGGDNDSQGSIHSCFNIGNVTGKNRTGGISGYKSDDIHNSYYLSGTAPGGSNGEDWPDMAEARTAGQFASGEVAWQLQRAITGDTLIWGQQLPADALPVLLSKHKVYAALFMHETEDLLMMGKYANLNAQIPLPTAEEVGAKGEVSFTDKSGNPVTETITLRSDTLILVRCGLYTVSISKNIYNGELSVSSASWNAGAEVPVETNSRYGYEPLCIRVKTFDGQESTYDYPSQGMASKFTFTMPAADVILSADFVPSLYYGGYTVSDEGDSYIVKLAWECHVSDYRTLIYRDDQLVHMTEINETSWQEQIDETGIYRYTIYAVDESGTRSRGTSFRVCAYPATRMETSGTQTLDLGDTPLVITDDGGRNEDYSNDVNATTVITAQEDCRIYLTGQYEVGYDGYDILSIFDSDDSLLGRYYEYGIINPALLSSGNTLAVRFTSDSYARYKGFDVYAETVYPVTIAEIGNGTVVADTAWAKAGDKVTLTPLPDGQHVYVEGSLQVRKADDSTVEVPVDADGSFTMPAFKIIVNARFESVNALPETEDATLRVFTTPGMLHIAGTEAEATIHDVRGMLIYKGMERDIQLPAGLYIVRAEGKVQKAVVK